MSTSLIQKQLTLLGAISSLANAARAVDNDELVIHAKDSSSNALVPIASSDVQADILTDSLCNEIRGSILEVIDSKVMQLSALGITISDEALSEIQSTSSRE
jgi:hypothetical protein